jgi:hypothetical protein
MNRDSYSNLSLRRRRASLHCKLLDMIPAQTRFCTSHRTPASCHTSLFRCMRSASNIDSAKHAWAILALLVKALRKRWPKVKIILRADSGFCRWKMLRWCERAGIHYLVGLAKNERLNTLSAKLHRRAQRRHQKTGHKVRLFSQFKYKAKTWDRKRRIIVKAEHSDRGANPRYVVTNLKGGSERLYDAIYCARG